MPWRKTCVMDERVKFIGLHLQQEMTMADLCRYFGISRVTGYKWLRRYEADGVDGLTDQSRAPQHHPHAVPEEVAEAIVSFRGAHPRWGPLKLRARLSQQHPQITWPAASTIGEMLKRHGLTVPRRRVRKSPRYSSPLGTCDAPNAVWSADFKGWFTTGDGARCDPFTVVDNYSRFLLRCQAVTRPDGESVTPVLEAAFREHGLPGALRTDNGPPFATTSVGALSRLSIWLIKLGVTPERIEPGKPAQNGRLERLHRTLKAETADPPQSTLRAQQKAFDRFREEYNHHRPHQALGQKTPASFYAPSARDYPMRLPEMVYPTGYELRKVRSQGEFKWHGRSVYLSDPLAGEVVGFQQIADHLYNIYFGPVRVALWNTNAFRIIRQKKMIERINKKYAHLGTESLPKVLTMYPD
jgi:putative transposase